MTRFWACKSCSVLWAKFSGLHTDQCSSADFHWVKMQTVNLSALVPSVPSSTLSRDLLQTFLFYHLQTNKQGKKGNFGILLPKLFKAETPPPPCHTKVHRFLEAATIVCLEDFLKCHSSKKKACCQIIETCQGKAFRNGSTASASVCTWTSWQQRTSTSQYVAISSTSKPHCPQNQNLKQGAKSESIPCF